MYIYIERERYICSPRYHLHDRRLGPPRRPRRRPRCLRPGPRTRTSRRGCSASCGGRDLPPSGWRENGKRQEWRHLSIPYRNNKMYYCVIFWQGIKHCSFMPFPILGGGGFCGQVPQWRGIGKRECGCAKCPELHRRASECPERFPGNLRKLSAFGQDEISDSRFEAGELGVDSFCCQFKWFQFATFSTRADSCFRGASVPRTQGFPRSSCHGISRCADFCGRLPACVCVRLYMSAWPVWFMCNVARGHARLLLLFEEALREIGGGLLLSPSSKIHMRSLLGWLRRVWLKITQIMWN